MWKLLSHTAIFPNRYVRLCQEVERRDELFQYSLSCIYHVNQCKLKCTFGKLRDRKVLEDNSIWDKKIEEKTIRPSMAIEGFLPMERAELDMHGNSAK